MTDLKLIRKDRRASLRRHEDEILANENAHAERAEIERNKKIINNFVIGCLKLNQRLLRTYS